MTPSLRYESESLWHSVSSLDDCDLRSMPLYVVRLTSRSSLEKWPLGILLCDMSNAEARGPCPLPGTTEAIPITFMSSDWLLVSAITLIDRIVSAKRLDRPRSSGAQHRHGGLSYRASLCRLRHDGGQTDALDHQPPTAEGMI